jgi:hypothetical protein
MSWEYSNYIYEHRQNVFKGLNWIQEKFPRLLDVLRLNAIDMQEQILGHDESKTEPDEYKAYDEWFYGGENGVKNRSAAVKEAYEKAWLLHIHRNPHHWQYWVLISDNPESMVTTLDMPTNYILEMICGWWSFSWKQGKLDEIFDWYDEHKEHFTMSYRTIRIVELILDLIRLELNYGEAPDNKEEEVEKILTALDKIVR